jgi:hypothetical protein
LPWDRYNFRPAPTAPARQKKIDAIKPAVEARGYQFAELLPSQGNWRVKLIYRPESIDVESDYLYSYGRPYVGGGTSVERGDFDDLLSLFRDIRPFAHYIHHLFGGGLRKKLQVAQQKYREDTMKYGDQQAHLLRANLEGREGEMPRIRAAITQLEGLASRWADEVAGLEAEIAAYNATVPTTDAEADAYLASRPRIKDRPPKEG